MERLSKFKLIVEIGFFMVAAAVLLNLNHRAEAVLISADVAIKNTNKRVSDTAQNTNAVLIQLGLAADQAQQAAREQRVYWSENSQQTTRALVNLNAFVTNTDRRLNTELFPAATATLQTLNAETAARSIDIHNLVESVRQPLDAATLKINDPNIEATIENIQKISGNLADATGDVKKIVHKATLPKTKAQIAAGMLLKLAPIGIAAAK